MKIGKYIFDSKESAQTKIDAFSESSHTFVHLGNIVIEDEILDDNQEVETEAVLSDDWHVDVLWVDLEADDDGEYSHPYGWANKSVDIDGNGIHQFMGLNYNDYKI